MDMDMEVVTFNKDIAGLILSRITSPAHLLNCKHVSMTWKEVVNDPHRSLHQLTRGLIFNIQPHFIGGERIPCFFPFTVIDINPNEQQVLDNPPLNHEHENHQGAVGNEGNLVQALRVPLNIPAISFNFLAEDAQDIKVESGCDGLLLCGVSRLNEPLTEYFVCNPLTEWFKRLPSLPVPPQPNACWYYGFALGFDRSRETEQFKVLYHIADENVSDIFYYTNEMDTWNLLPLGIDGDPIWKLGEVVYVQNKFYLFHCFFGDDARVLSLDTESLVFFNMDKQFGDTEDVFVCRSSNGTSILYNYIEDLQFFCWEWNITEEIWHQLHFPGEPIVLPNVLAHQQSKLVGAVIDLGVLFFSVNESVCVLHINNLNVREVIFNIPEAYRGSYEGNLLPFLYAPLGSAPRLAEG